MIVECLKDIKLLGRIIFSKGQLYDTDNTPKLLKNTPLMVNYSSPDFFEKFNRKFQDEQIVRYNPIVGKPRYGTVTAFDRFLNSYCVKLDNGERVETKVERLSPVEIYYFINSEGHIHEQFKGKNTNRDNFCQLNGNMFKTLDEANGRLNEILNNK